jgi:hypothetical protein
MPRRIAVVRASLRPTALSLGPRGPAPRLPSPVLRALPRRRSRLAAVGRTGVLTQAVVVRFMFPNARVRRPAGGWGCWGFERELAASREWRGTRLQRASTTATGPTRRACVSEPASKGHSDVSGDVVMSSSCRIHRTRLGYTRAFPSSQAVGVDRVPGHDGVRC